jgi:ribosomal protein S18 acetylase RimI-like enzyme
MLYQALYMPPGTSPLPREVIDQPPLAKYIQSWGRATDHGLLAETSADRIPVGAAWLRLLTGEAAGYGYVDDQTPELSIALQPDQRGQGLGSRLLAALLAEADQDYPAVSLSVSPDNPARRLYERFGFVVVGTDGSSLTMRRTRPQEVS